MSGRRRAFLDRSPGEGRAVVFLDGRPERLILAWDDDPVPRLGARYAARVDVVSDRMGLARLDIGAMAASLRFRPDLKPAVGERLEVEVIAEPVRGKPAAVRRLGPSTERPGRLQTPPSLEAELISAGFETWTAGDEARDAADEAQSEALAPEHALPNGLNLRIETTRALTAVDVDLAETGAVASASRANLEAIGQAARLLRLKALGGLVAIDLIGASREARRLQVAAAEAFAPDGPEVAIGTVSRFGVLELAKPHRRQPLHERLGGSGGDGLNARATAHELVRALERQGRHEPGSLMQARAAPAVAALAAPLAARLGPRFNVQPDLGCAPSAYDIQAR